MLLMSRFRHCLPFTPLTPFFIISFSPLMPTFSALIRLMMLMPLLRCCQLFTCHFHFRAFTIDAPPFSRRRHYFLLLAAIIFAIF
jgi:hypothetical protein